MNERGPWPVQTNLWGSIPPFIRLAIWVWAWWMVGVAAASLVVALVFLFLMGAASS